jgi:ribosomal protein S18 acetylase RimI-like enzyme
MSKLEYLVLEPLRNRPWLRDCQALIRQRLHEIPLQRLLNTLRMHRRRLLVVAHEEGKLVGFKLGYADKPRRFYSWLGAVDQAWEGRGIGRRLMEIQHQELRERGYHSVRTHTRNEFRRMLLLNILSGFDVIGVRARRSGSPHILLEKRFLTAVDPHSGP